MSLIISKSSTTEAGVIAHWGSSAPMSLKELLVEASRCLQNRGKSNYSIDNIAGIDEKWD